MGDLIDRNGAVEILRAKANITVCMDIQMGYESSARIIEHIPAVDAEPVRHGKWIWNENGMDWNIGAWVCSECGMRNENIHSDMKLNPYIWAGTKYCPNCGARMDGGEKDG